MPISETRQYLLSGDRKGVGWATDLNTESIDRARMGLIDAKIQLGCNIIRDCLTETELRQVDAFLALNEVIVELLSARSIEISHGHPLGLLSDVSVLSRAEYINQIQGIVDLLGRCVCGRELVKLGVTDHCGGPCGKLPRDCSCGGQS